jgi:hypothetical protein
VRQVEQFNFADDVFVETFVSRLQIIFDGVQTALGPGDFLSANGGFRIGMTDGCRPETDARNPESFRFLQGFRGCEASADSEISKFVQT